MFYFDIMFEATIQTSYPRHKGSAMSYWAGRCL